MPGNVSRIIVAKVHNKVVICSIIIFNEKLFRYDSCITDNDTSDDMQITVSVPTEWYLIVEEYQLTVETGVIPVIFTANYAISTIWRIGSVSRRHVPLEIRFQLVSGPWLAKSWMPLHYKVVFGNFLS